MYLFLGKTKETRRGNLFSKIKCSSSKFSWWYYIYFHIRYVINSRRREKELESFTPGSRIASIYLIKFRSENFSRFLISCKEKWFDFEMLGWLLFCHFLKASQHVTTVQNQPLYGSKPVRMKIAFISCQL